LTAKALAIITNNHSTQNRGDTEWLNTIVRGHKWIHHFGIDHPSKIAYTIQCCAELNIDTIMINGGDGTIGLVLSALLNDGPFKTPPPLALLPSGKTNMTAKSWSLNGDPKPILEIFLKRYSEGLLDKTTLNRNILTIHEENQLPKHGAFFGAAEIVEGILYCRKHIYPMALPNSVSHMLSITALLMRAIRRNQTSSQFQAIDNTNNWSDEGEFFAFVLTTMDKLLLGIRPEKGQGQGPINYMSIKSGFMSICAATPHIMKRRIMSGYNRTVRNSQSVTLLFDGHYTLDGELYVAKKIQPLTITSKHILRFIQ
jgi:hypothetical protein